MVTGKEKRVLNLKYLKGKYISDKDDDQTMSKYKCLAMLNVTKKKIKKLVEKKNRRPTSLNCHMHFNSPQFGAYRINIKYYFCRIFLC